MSATVLPPDRAAPDWLWPNRQYAATLTAGSSNGLAIDLHRVYKYLGATMGVDGIDPSVESGEIVAILGPNGAGKSTTIDIVLG